MTSRKIAVTGAGGFVGSLLKRRFSGIVPIARNATLDEIKRALEGAHVVINLAGAPIIKRWSESYKKVLYSSRIETTRRLVEALNSSDVEHFISTSATGIYPDDMDCDESCPRLADDFLGRLARDWEMEASKCKKKTTILRFGVVLGNDGGALKRMLLPFRLGLGGPIGDGSSVLSWIDIEDLMRIYEFVLETGIEGVLNAVSPRPVTNKEFTKALARVLRRPAILPVPPFILRLLYGEGATVITGSKRVYPNRLLEAGFRFKYPDIHSSLQHLLA
ncbi:MAG: TIGR01777 family protein [Thermodesulfobacteria bacterium]|nr:TIGR01777 family protein [Thermodesulfobacteriota bacterium]